MKILRNIVEIDEEKCDGCGLCVPGCHEGAIEIRDGKARIVKDSYCDGLGACLGECPRGALKIVQKEVDPFVDPRNGKTAAQKPAAQGGCPGMMAKVLGKQASDVVAAADAPSQLTQWPVQLHLVPVNAPYWKNASLLIAADCSAFTLGAFHDKLLRGKKLAIACPKLDETEEYVDKLAAIIAQNEIADVTVAFMEVPCCMGLVMIVEKALARSGRKIPLKKVRITLEGEMEEL